MKEETKLERWLGRCGACGAWQSNPLLFTKEEQDNFMLIHCGCEENTSYEPTAREMYSAGIISKSEYEGNH